MKLLLLGALLLVALASSSHAKDTKQGPKVEIFYETLNDAVRKFFVEQYKIASDNFIDQIDLRLYPYGNTVKNGDGTYTCPYNDDQQCLANKLHVCLIKAEMSSPPTPPNADTPINQVPVSSFVNCFFKNRYAEDDLMSLGERCDPSGVETDWVGIKECIDQDATANDIFGTITGTVATDIKTDGLVVRIGGTVNANAKTNLVGEICKALVKTDGICAQAATAPTKVKLGIYYEAFNNDAKDYLVKQMAAYYHVLEDFVDLDLVPYGNTQLLGDGYNCSTEAQCISNKFQALVIDKYLLKPLNGDAISGENRAINFLTCLYQSTVGSVFSSLEICANQKLEFGDYMAFLGLIKTNDPQVKTVFESMRTKTVEIAPNGLQRIPTVTINGKIDYNAFDDLVQEACAQYNGPIKSGICTKVNMTVLYEPLNHKSRTLFLEQLKPVFGNNLYNLINLQMIPAGRAVLAPGHGFVCPGGADQCTAMKLQACAIDYFWNDGNNYTDPIRQEIFDFIVCTFKNKRMLGVYDAAELCSEDFLPDADAWVTIHGCILEGTADAILAEYIEETQSIITDVANHAIPIVIIDGKEITDLSTIKAEVCKLFDDYHQPDYCQSDMPAKVKIQVFYESMSDLSKYFFTSQYDPWYMYVEEMASIDLYPAGNVIEQNYTDGTCDSYETNSVCIANKLQSLIIDRYNKHDDDGDFVDGTLRTMKFLSCVFNHADWKTNVYGAYEYCTEEELIFDDWFDILVTAKAEAGAAIYKGVLDATQKFKTDNQLVSLDPVPWVTLDNQKHSKRAADDLLQTVCSQYPGDKPPECTPVQVEVYYSGVNPQSRRFFLDQLFPVFRNLRERLHLDLIPFGVPTPGQTIEQECANKDKICLANKLQACAIDKFFKDEVIDNSVQWDGKNQTLSYILCMFKNIKNLDVSTLAEECANNNIVLGDEIMACAKQDEGTQLLTAMRAKTMAQYQDMEHAPWIVINGIRSSLAESDLKSAICDAMIGDKPDYCYNPTPAKVKVEFHYSTFDTNVQSYVISELYPHYRLLEEIMEVDVVPFGLTEVLSQDDGNYTLICPKGVDECHTNLIHACVYGEFWNNDQDPVSDNQNEYDGRLQVIEFINCYFSSPKYPGVDASEACVESVFGDIYSSIKDCAQSEVGRNFLLEFQEKKVNTLLPHLTYIPWMTTNGRHNYAIENHIQRTVCDSFTGTEKPQDCYQIYDSIVMPVVEIHYEIGDVGSKYFFASSLMPDHVNEIGVVNMVPFGRSTYTDTTKNCRNDAACKQYMEHACLLKLYLQSETVQTLKTIACTFGDQMTDPNVVNECVNQELDHIPDAWEAIQSCVVQEGEALLKANSDLVSGLAPTISHMPWVLIQGEHNIEAEVSLCNELCASYYPADKPGLCKPKLLPVNIYYETKNDAVSGLMLNSLSQYDEYLDEIGQFTFIPYGSTTNNNGQLVCSQGDVQCHANKVHACVLNRYYNQSSVNTDYEKNRIRTVGFIICTFFKEMGSPDSVNNAEACLNENFEGDLWRDIHYCYAGPEGDDIMKEMARQTEALDPKLTSAPYVTIGSKYNSNAAINLFQALCNAYPMVKAPLCATLPSYAVKVGIYFSGNAAGQKYLTEQVLPFYKEIVPVLREGTSETKLHAAISPDLVAWGDTKYNPDNADNPFTCEGEKECYINRLFACVNFYHGSEPRATLHIIEFALCFFSNEQALANPQQVANNCTNRVWIPDPYVQLDLCATEKDKQSYDIFLKAKAKTENNYPRLTSFPAVTINNLRNDEAEKNLLSAVCKNYQGGDYPAECEGIVDIPTTTENPGGSGTMPAISIFALMITFILARFL